MRKPSKAAPVQHQFDEEVAEHRSPTQDLVFPEAMAEENPFGDAPSPFEDEPCVEMESEPEADFSEESSSEEEPSLAADPWPTEENLPEVSESVEELYGQSSPGEEYLSESGDYENEEDFLVSAESAAFDEEPTFDRRAFL